MDANLTPRIGSIALCTRGSLGVITSATVDPASVDAQDEVLRDLYQGYKLDDGMVGRNWQTTAPRVVGHVSEIMDAFAALRAKASAPVYDVAGVGQSSADRDPLDRIHLAYRDATPAEIEEIHRGRNEALKR